MPILIDVLRANVQFSSIIFPLPKSLATFHMWLFQWSLPGVTMTMTQSIVAGCQHSMDLEYEKELNV